MSACEKCWADANWQARLTGRSTVEVYQELLRVRDCGDDAAGGNDDVAGGDMSENTS